MEFEKEINQFIREAKFFYSSEDFVSSKVEEYKYSREMYIQTLQRIKALEKEASLWKTPSEQKNDKQLKILNLMHELNMMGCLSSIEKHRWKDLSMMHNKRGLESEFYHYFEELDKNLESYFQKFVYSIWKCKQRLDSILVSFPSIGNQIKQLMQPTITNSRMTEWLKNCENCGKNKRSIIILNDCDDHLCPTKRSSTCNCVNDFHSYCLDCLIESFEYFWRKDLNEIIGRNRSNYWKCLMTCPKCSGQICLFRIVDVLNESNPILKNSNNDSDLSPSINQNEIKDLDNNSINVNQNNSLSDYDIMTLNTTIQLLVNLKQRKMNESNGGVPRHSFKKKTIDSNSNNNYNQIQRKCKFCGELGHFAKNRHLQEPEYIMWELKQKEEKQKRLKRKEEEEEE